MVCNQLKEGRLTYWTVDGTRIASADRSQGGHTVGREIPPGWYEDQHNPGRQRWWDGENWTNHFAASPPPPSISNAPTMGDTGPRGSRQHRARPWWQRKRLLIPSGLVGLIMIAGVADFGTQPSDEQIATDPAVTTDSSIEPTTTTRASSTIVSTAPPTSPETSTTAVTTLGLSTETRNQSAAQIATTGPTSTVKPTTTTTRPATTTTTTTTTIRTTTTAPAPSCDPNYSGCVPIASDVDCAGGSGNGPAYVTGPVQVVGSDIYDLDRDKDGIGCE